MAKISRIIRKLTLKGGRILQALDDNPVLIANQAVNFDLRCIFIAVPKNGTTSVRRQINPKGIPLIKTPHLNIIQVRDLIYLHLLRSALGRNVSFPTQSVPSDAEIRNRARETFSTFFKFSAVRNPWARAVSIYHRREGIQVNAKMTFDEFCEKYLNSSDTCLHPTLHKNQFDWLCDENGTCMMDYVYKVEDFGEAIGEIDRRTDGRIKLIEQKLNKNLSSRSKDYRELYNPKTRDLIGKRFEKDIDYFKYTF